MRGRVYSTSWMNTCQHLLQQIFLFSRQEADAIHGLAMAGLQSVKEPQVCNPFHSSTVLQLAIYPQMFPIVPFFNFFKIPLSRVYYFICYFQANIQQQLPTSRTFIAEKTKVHALKLWFSHAPAQRCRRKIGEETLAQLRRIFAQEDSGDTCRIKVFDKKGKS